MPSSARVRRRSRTSRAAACSTKRQQLVVVVLGLARVADDEVRRGTRRRARRPRMSSMRRRKRSPSPHRRMRRSSGLRHVLQREVEVRARRSRTITSIRRVGEVGRVEVEQADPRRPLRRPPRRAARSSRAPELGRRPCRTTARSWATSTISCAPSCVDLGEDRRRRSRLRCGPRKRRDGAEPAACGRSPRRSSRRPTARSSAGRGRLSRSSVGTGAVAGADAGSVRPRRHRHAEAGDRVDLGQRGGQLVAVALGHAAR